MPGFRRINIDRLPQLARRLQRFVKKLRARLPVERVILHGSAARDDLTESSDLDIVVIGDFRGRRKASNQLVLTNFNLFYLSGITPNGSVGVSRGHSIDGDIARGDFHSEGL